MFVKAIEKVAGFTRPIHTITRSYGSTVVEPSAATLFFVNELGYAVTCKHVAELVVHTDSINKKYKDFLNEREVLPANGKYNKRLRELEQKYGLGEGIIQIKNTFLNCVDKMTQVEVLTHPTLDLAVIHFLGFENLSYKDYAVFLKDSSQAGKQGRMLCRLGYPFAEFSNYSYNSVKDDIEWADEGRKDTPAFPIDGMVTRQLLDKDGHEFGIEISTPGLKGQSGGPLFDGEGIVYGMQFSTHFLHLGFDIKDKEVREAGRSRKVSNYPFLHLGACVHVDVIKTFLKENGIKYYESE